MNTVNYLEMLPLNNIAKYTRGQPGDGVPFMGFPRSHPSEKDKLILVADPLGPAPVVLEFKLDDVLYIEEIPSAVTETGEGVPLVKLWIKQKAVGMILEPFEVSNSIHFAGKIREVKERIHAGM
jgi:inorganic pyrophosphatase